MELDNNKSENSFFLFILSFVLFLSSSIVVFSNRVTQKKQASTPIPQTTVSLTEAESVLGSSQINYDAPRVIISGGDGYGSGGVVPIASTDEPSVYVTSFNFNGEAEIFVYKADEKLLLDYLTHDKENKQLKQKPDVSSLNLVTSIKQKITSSGYQSESKVLLPLEENGIWFLLIKTPKTEEYAYVLRSDFGVLTKEGDNQLIFWAQSFKTKRKISGGNLKLYNLLNTPKTLEETSFDDNGIASTALNPDADVALANFDGKLALIPINLRYLDKYNYRAFLAKTINTKYFIFVDRPIYQPGDTIYFKAVLRDDDDARYSIPQGTAKVKIYQGWDEKSNIVYENTLSINSNGSVFGEFKLPEGASTGSYQLKVDTGKTISDSWSNYSGSNISFQVQYYRKPEYNLNLEIAQREVISKDDLSFTFRGEYFSGQPLTGQPVSYKITSGDFYDYSFYQDYSSLGDRDYYWWGYGYNSEVTSGNAVLDEKGEARVQIKADLEGIGKNRVFTIQGEIDNGSGNPSFVRKNVLVYSGEFGIYRSDYGYGSMVYKEISIPLIFKPYFSGNVSQIPLKVKVRRENWVPKWNKDEKYPTYEKETENFPDLRLTTDNNGESTIKFMPSKVGSYVFSVEATDARGNLVKKDFYTWVTDKDYSYNYDQFRNELTVKADKEKYLPSETANLTIYSSTPDRDVFLSLERGRMDRFKTISLQGKSAIVPIMLVGSDLPNIYTKVSSFSNYALDEGLSNISISTESKKIVVSLTPDQKKYGPGDTVSLNVQTQDTAGNPISAELAVWAVDKALFELIDQKPGIIFDTFWQERGDNTAEAHSLQGIIVPSQAEMGGCFSGETKILLADGTQKPINQIKPGEVILTKENDFDSKLVKTKVKSTHSTLVSGYLIINGNLKVTENHYLFVNGGWKEAGSVQKGDTFLNQSNEKIKITSIEWIRGQIEVYNLEVEKYHTFFAGGIYVHNQKGEGRTVFKDAAYWNPTVQTDTDGRAKLTFKLPDNLTTWVIAGIAASNETRVGQSTNEIIVTKNVIVRPILPNILRIGDRLFISSLMQNFTDTDQNFKVGIDFDSGSVEGAKEVNVLIKAKETKQVSWWINPQKENPKAKLVFSATSKENEKDFDKITQEIPVWTFGFSDKSGFTGEGNKDYSLKFLPDVDLSKSKVTLFLSPNLHGSLLSAMQYLIYYPYGCVEQTTSAFVPAVIVKENFGLYKDYLGDQDLDKIINNSILRLSKLQKSDGSFSWWGHSDSDFFVTAYVIEYVTRAKKLGFDDKEILSKAQQFLQSGSGTNQTGNNAVFKAYGLSFFSDIKSKTVANIDSTNSTDILALAVLTNLRNGDKNPQTNGLSKLISLAQTQGEEAFWQKGSKVNFGSIDASTALVSRALIAGGADRTLITKAIRYLMKSRHFDYWTNSFATAQVIQAVSDFVSSENENTPDYTYTVSLNNEILRSGKVENVTQKIDDLIISNAKLKGIEGVVTVNKTGVGQIYSSLIVDQWHTDKNAAAESHGITVKREYLESDRSGVYKVIGVGDEVTVKLTIQGLLTSENYAVLADELPSGLIPVNQDFANEQSSKKYFPTNCYVSEITKNGVVLSLYNVGPGENVCYYPARAVLPGTFIVPPATISLMYSPEIWARTGVSSIEIKEARVVTKFKSPYPPVTKFMKRFSLWRYWPATVVLAGVGIIIRRLYLKKKKLSPPTPPEN